MERVNCHHERTHANHVVLRVAHFFCTVVNAVEFANFITVTDFLEQCLDCFTGAWLLEIVFTHSAFGEGGGVEQVNGFGLVSVVLVVGH